MSLSRGDRLDRYEVLELLGTGGMGEVYRAHDHKLARDVALKVLRLDTGAEKTGASRLLREARAVAALSHPNVLTVFDVGEVMEPQALRGLGYIAMELVPGRSLRSYLGDPAVPLEQRMNWLRDVGRALEAAHRAGIVHRDVKAENVMIRSDGVVKVLDFGIARRAAASLGDWSPTGAQTLRVSVNDSAQGLQTITRQGTVVGTPFYMAPEQLRGEELDSRADQFGWGVVAYWLLTATPPWSARSDLSLLSEILSADPLPPAERDVRLPVGVSNVIMRALSKSRESRFSSMTDLLYALDESMGAAPTTFLPTEEFPLPKEPERPRSIRRRATLALLVSAIVASGSIGTLMWRARNKGNTSVLQQASGVNSAGECTTNADCVHSHPGEAWHCNARRHVCVEISSKDCTAHFEVGDPEADDVVWLGGMFPLSSDPSVVSEVRAAELARQDFASALGRSAGSTGASHVRPIALVVCDEGVDAVRAAHHLIDDVEVPAAMGFRSTASALQTIPTIFLPSRTLSFITISQAPEITKLPEPAGKPRLIWRSTLNRTGFAAPQAAFISDVLEPAARIAEGGVGHGPLRVAAVWAKATNHDVVEALFGALRFNGRSALENGSNFRQFVYENGQDGGVNDVVDELLAFSPQIIVFANLGFYGHVLVPLEAAWATRGHGLRPTYLTGSGLTAPAMDFAGRDPSRRRRLFAVTNRATTMTNAQLVLRYNVSFPSEPVTRTEAPQPSYDAFYILAYATYAIGGDPITGDALARGIERLLPPGRQVDVGPTGIGEAVGVLRAGGRIDLNGSIGSLDLDPRTGEGPIDYAIVCLDIDDHGRAAATVDSGLFYDSRTQRLVGKMKCP